MDDPQIASQSSDTLAAGASWRWPWLPFALLLLLVLGLFDGVLLRGETFFDRDLVLFFRPLRAQLVELWRAAGGVPLWDPVSNMGREFAANPSAAVFHPLSWLFLLVPWETALRVQVLVPVLISFGGMLFFLRTSGRRAPSAFFGACAWGFGGVTLSMINLLSMLLTMAPAPLLAAFAVRTVRRRRPLDVAGAAASFALACAGGEPVSLLMTCLIVGAAVGNELLQRDSRGDRVKGRAALHGVMLVGAGVTLGAAAAAVVIVPALRLAASSERAQGIPLARAEVWSFPPVRFAEFVLPSVMGHIAPDITRYWGGAAYDAKQYPLVYSIYPGLLAAVLGLSSLAQRRRGRFVWVGTGVMAALLALGSHVPIWRLFHASLPVWRGIRHPERLVILLAFAVTVLAAEELDAVLAGERDVRRRTTKWLIGVVCFAALSGAAVLVITRWAGAAHWSALGILPSATGFFARRFPIDCLVAAGLAAAYLAALHMPPSPLRKGAAPICATLVLDLFIAGKPLVPTMPPQEVAAMFPVPRSLAGARPTRLFDLAEWQTLSSARMLAPGMGVPAKWGVPTAFGTDADLSRPLWGTRSDRLFWSAVNSQPNLLAPLLRRRGVGAVLLRAPEVAERPGSAADGGQQRMQLAPLEGAQPDAFCVAQVVRFRGDEAWLSEVRVLGTRVADTALVEAGDGPLLPPAPSRCRVESFLSRPGLVRLTVTAEGPAASLLAVNQSWNPRWSATVDGGKAQIVRTDLDLTGIPLEPGFHAVELVYRDRLLLSSLAVSIVTLLAIAALAAASLSGRQTKRPVPA
ncbi:MAG: YfhO family protein [Acidobacteriia bacterium]|nr:YfhO family protein [Terriglobia bacterium]